MAYNSVGTPRFYIDQIQYLKSVGFDFMQGYLDAEYPASTLENEPFTNGSQRTLFTDPDIFTFTPEIQKYMTSHPPNAANNWFYWVIPTGLTHWELNGDNVGRYIALLNHDLGDRKYSVWSDWAWYDNEVWQFDENPRGKIILNADDYGNWGAPVNNGVTIMELDKDYGSFNPSDTHAQLTRIGFGMTVAEGEPGWLETNEVSLGALSWGTYYDMPQNPDLALTMEIEFDGYDNTETVYGSTITNINHSGSPWWYDIEGNKHEPFYVGDSTGMTKRNGRRIWNLKFSYLKDTDLFSSNPMSNTYMNQDSDAVIEPEDVDDYNWGQNIVTEPTFNTDTGWNKNPNWTINTGDEVAICSGDDEFPDDAGEDINHKTGGAGSAEINRIYKVVFKIKTLGEGGFRFTFGGHSGTARESTGTFEEIMTATTTERLRIRPVTDESECEIDFIYVYPSNPKDFQYNIDTDNSFESMVLNKISHGEKFIFQPDNTANNPSDFAICTLDQDSVSFKRTAFNVYDIEMKIKEVW